MRYVGILSSHPFAIMAVLSVFRRQIGHSEHDLVRSGEDAARIMKACPVTYVRQAEVRTDEVNAVCCANTKFWVDHEEPKKALATLEHQRREWQIGDLPEGHEYLIIVDTRSAK